MALPNPAINTAQLTVTHATVLTGSCADDLILSITTPSGVWPYRGTAHVSMQVAINTGLRYVCTHLRGVPTNIVTTGVRRQPPMADHVEYLVDWGRNCVTTATGDFVMGLPEPWDSPPEGSAE